MENRLLPKKLWLFALTLLLFVTTTKANPVDMRQAREIGAQFVNGSTNMRTTADALRHVITYSTDNGEAAFYVFNTTNGFVIVAADDCSTPILGYSVEGQFDVDNIPVQMEDYLQVFRRQIQYGIEHGQTADESVSKQWNMLRTTGTLRGTRSTRAVAPLLTTIWDQDCLYNTLCPIDTEGPCGHVYAGCLATAMGQIMRYWQYPGIGSGSHTYTPEGYPEQTVDFGATTYDWGNMPDYVNSSMSTEAQLNAIATLLWHCGVAVDMMYGASGSGAYIEDAAIALPEYFNYSNDLFVGSRTDNESWLAQVKANLDMGLPVLYSGTDTIGGGGHAFVCDGYDSNDYLHFNWGWSGSNNNYFALDALNTPNGNFNAYNSAIFNIYPDNTVFYEITAEANPTEGGTVTGGGTYSQGELCTLTAVGAYDYAFVNWTKNGVEVSTSPVISFEVTENAIYTANFELFDGVMVLGESLGLNEYLPSYSYYCHSLTQQIYMPSDIPQFGSIKSLAFYNDGATKIQDLDIYLAYTDKDSFTSTTDWIPVTSDNLVFSGVVTMVARTWTTITLDNQFDYDGQTNIVLVVDNNTGSWTDQPHMACRVFGTDEVQAIRVYSDETDYDPSNPTGYTGTLYSVKNQLRISFDLTSTEPVAVPNALVLGDRPNNAWARPYTFMIHNPGGYSYINSITTDNPYFQLEEVEIPFELGPYQSRQFIMTTGNGDGEMNGHLIINYGDNETVQFDLSAFAYDPAVKDVWETAYEITDFPYTDSLVVADIPLHNNYDLPPTDTEDGADAVYKLVFDQDVLLNAAFTSGENGKMALYTEDFYGEGGPMATNNYTGNNGTNRSNGDIDVLTVYDGTITNSYVPFYGLWVDAYTRNEMIYPAAVLTEMIGSDISSLTFYKTSSNTNSWGSASFQIYVTEVPNTTLNGYIGMEDATIVYSGSIDAAGGERTVTIDFITPYHYFGGNLLVGVYETVTGSYSSAYWYGESVTGASVSGYNSSSPANANYNQRNFLPKTTFSYQIIDNSGISNMTLPRGTYYLAASSTSEAWGIEINTDSAPCPEMAYDPTPANYETEVIPTAVQLQWSLGEGASEYKLLFGLDPDNLNTLVDWTRDLPESYTVTGLLNNTSYYWQVIGRNDGCPEGVEGPVWEFTTNLSAPYLYTMYTGNPYYFNDSDVYLGWVPMSDTCILSYNIYRDNELVYNTTGNIYAADPLPYNMEGYHFNLTAVYAGGESNLSNTLTVFVSGYGTVEGYVYEQDGIVGIENAVVSYVGEDEFGYTQTYAFTTDANGYYTGVMKVGNYYGSVYSVGYQTVDEPVQGNPIVINYNDVTGPIDYILDENFTPVGLVIAEYYPDADDPNSPYVKVHSEEVTDFLYDFDDYTLQGWTALDGDGDEMNWFVVKPSDLITTVTGAHSGSYAVISMSWFQTALNPDNWLISPEMDGAVRIHYFVADDTAYPDHYALMVSSSGNSIEDFTTVFEETVSDNGNRTGEMGNVNKSLDRNMSSWLERNIVLPEGTKYVAFRHYNSYDKYYLLIDDITISAGSSVNRSFQSYRYYRTDAYNDGPYIEENTVLLAENTTDNEFVDLTWENAESGVYKYGMSRVYAGNRESGNGNLIDFEDGAMPEGWQATSSVSNNWNVTTTSQHGNIVPYAGNYALYHNGAGSSAYAYFVSPAMQFYGTASLSFAYTTPNWVGDINKLSVGYGTSADGPWTWLMEDQQNDGWTTTTLDLNGLTGTYYICFRSYDAYGYCTAIDDINIDIEIHSIQVPRESEIVWSSPIEKSMNLGENEVNITVSLNSGDSPAGVTVSFTNLNPSEQELYPMSDIVLDSTGYYAFESFRCGDYQVEISLDNYYTITEEVSIWDATALNYILNEINNRVTDLYVSSTGWAMWTDTEHGNTVPFIITDPTEFFFDFEDDQLEGWTVLDVNSGGGTWVHSSNNPSGYNYTPNGHEGSSGFAMCYSYVDNVGSYNTDSYLITAQKYSIVNGSTLTFWADNANDTWAENFSVCIATTSNVPTASDFTQIWSGVAKGNSNTKTEVRHLSNRYNNWRYHSIDLSAYAGQSVWIAFHDVNYDMYEIWIDDVALTTGAKGQDGQRHFQNYRMLCTDAEDNVILDTTTSNCYYQLPTDELVEGETYHLKVAEVYSSGLSEWREVDWVYQSCSNNEGFSSLTAEFLDEGNTLSWSYPGNEGISYDVQIGNGNGYVGSCPINDYQNYSISQQLYLASELEAMGTAAGPISSIGWFRRNTYDYHFTHHIKIWMANVTDNAVSTTSADVNAMTLVYDGEYTVIRDWNMFNVASFAWDGMSNLLIVVVTDAIGTYDSNQSSWWRVSGTDFTASCHNYSSNNPFYPESQTYTLYGVSNRPDLRIVTKQKAPIGAMLYREGELLGFVQGISYTDSLVTGNHEYEMRVVYDGSAGLPNNNVYYSMSCPQTIGGATYEVTVAADPEECGVVTGGGSFINGSSCTVTATANPGYQFTNWTINDVVVSTELTYTFFVHENAVCVAHFNNSQTIPLAAGWNWMNSYIELNNMDALGIFEEGLGDNGIQIQSQDAYVVNYNGFWMGELESLTNEQTYLVQILADTSMMFYGPVAQPSDHPIAMSIGWNWIGYPVSTEMSVDEAFANFLPTDGDEVKAQSDYAVYYSGYGWIGDLNTIMPGMGLMYHAANSGTFTYPEFSRGDELAKNGTRDGEHWTNDIHAYPTNMTMMAVVELNGEELQSERYELAAFANGEIRGSAKLMYVQPLDRYVAFLTIAGDEAVELHFGLYNEVTGEETFDSDDHMTYTINAIVGIPNEPSVVHFRGMTGLDDFDRNLYVYPNPVTLGERFGLSLPVGNEVRVETVNSLGVVVSMETSTKASATIKAPETSGVYTLRITVEGKGTYIRKLIVR